MQQYSNSLFRQFPNIVSGNAAIGVSVHVYELGTTNHITLYADDDLGGATLPNPLTTNDIGFYSFYAPNGKYTLHFSSSQYADLEINMYDAVDLANEFNAAQAATGYILIDNGFSVGYTVTQRNEALLDGGVYYVWKGALPKVITAGSSVAATGGIGNGSWQAVLDNTLEQRLVAGTAPIGSVTSGGVSDLVEGIADGSAVFSGMHSTGGLASSALSAAIDGKSYINLMAKELSDAPEISGIDLSLESGTLKDSPSELVLGGSVDSATTISLSVTSLAKGAREIPYSSLSGSLAAGDWVVVAGHCVGAFATAGGRNVESRAMLRVRAVDTVNKIIKLAQSIPEELDTETISSVVYGLSVVKVLPKKVYTKNINLSGSAVVLRYIIDSDIDFSCLGVSSENTSVVVEYATNCTISSKSESDNSSPAAHNLTTNYLYNCKIDFSATGTNYVASAAKCFRASSLSLCDVNVKSTDAGINTAVIEVMSGGKIDIQSFAGGAWNIDNNVTAANRNDGIVLNYLRGVTGSAIAIEPDCTGVELFNVKDSNIFAGVVRNRTSPIQGNSGLVNIKAICQRSNIGVFIRAFNDVSGPALRMEFSDSDATGVQSDCEIVHDIITDTFPAIIMRDPFGTSMQARFKLYGYCKSPQPLDIRAEIEGNILDGGTYEVDTASGPASHAVILNSTGNRLIGTKHLGTLGTTRRATTSPLSGNIYDGCVSDGGEFVYSQNPITTFNIREWRNLNNPIGFLAKSLKFYPSILGGYEIDGVETFEAAISQQILSQVAASNTMNFGTWQVGDTIRKRSASVGEIGWVWDGTYFVRTGYRVRVGLVGNSLGAIAAGASTSFTVPITGVAAQDFVAWSFTGGSSLLGLLVDAYVSSANVVTVNLYNPTASPIDPIAGTWYITATQVTR